MTRESKHAGQTVLTRAQITALGPGGNTLSFTDAYTLTPGPADGKRFCRGTWSERIT